MWWRGAVDESVAWHPPILAGGRIKQRYHSAGPGSMNELGVNAPTAPPPGLIAVSVTTMPLHGEPGMSGAEGEASSTVESARQSTGADARLTHIAGGNRFGQRRGADPAPGPCSVQAKGRSPRWTRGSRTSTATQAAMNEATLAKSRGSIRTSSGPPRVVRDANRPLLVCRKHKTCLIRQVITTCLLGIANRSANRRVVARVLWCVEGGDVCAEEDVLPNICPTSDTEGQRDV